MALGEGGLGKQEVWNQVCHPRDRTAIDNTLSVLVTGGVIKANHLSFIFFFFFCKSLKLSEIQFSHL